jgi:hypothetical protein
MTIPEGSGAPVSRAKEFLKGLFLPVFFTLPGFVVFPFLEHYDSARMSPHPGVEAYPIGGAFVLIGSFVLITRWWARSRWRAYGVIAGFFAVPPILVGAFIAWLVLSGNLYPR